MFLIINNIVKSLKIIFLVCFISIFIYPQEHNEVEFTHLTVEDGLSLNSVTKIFQDSMGFVWIGTYGGLNRYDGYNFKIFLPEPSDPYSISNHSILDICEDNEGFIWIATKSGLNKYNRKTEKFYKYFHDESDSGSLSYSEINSVLKDESGQIWIGTANGLNKYNRGNDNFSRFIMVSDELNINSLNSITCMYEDHYGNIWLGTWKGLTCLLKNGGKKYITLPDGTKQDSYNQITDITEDSEFNIWIGTNGKGLFKYNPIAEIFSHYLNDPDDPESISSNNIRVIDKNKSNDIWIGTQNGINILNTGKNTFTRITHDYVKPLSLTSNNISTILQDRTGLIWCGTNRGVSKTLLQNKNFHFINKKDNYTTGRINSLILDKKSNLWIGTNDGLDKINLQINTVKKFKNIPGNNNSLSSNVVMSIIEDYSGKIWVGTDGGLNLLDPETGKLSFFLYDESVANSLSNHGIISLCEDRKKNLWVGTWWGLNLLNRSNGTFRRFTKFKNNLCWVIYEDSRGMLWIGTDGGGVNEFDPVKETFINFSNDSSGKNYLIGNRVISVYESRDGMMWFGTTDGLSSYNPQEKKFINFSKNDGLPSNIINGMAEDKKGYIWISTDKGLSKFDRKNREFKNYSKRSGLKDIEFTPNTSAVSKEGNIFFGSNSGILYFDPAGIKDNKVTVPVVFTDLKIFNQSVNVGPEGILKETITSAKHLEIPFDKDVITIEYALLDYYNAKRNTFRYKLKGFDENWNDVGKRNSATYTNLPPGDYTFIVKATNNDGMIDEKQASLKLTIVPAYYQTLWFKMSFSLGIMLLVFLFFHKRTSLIKKQNKILEKRVSERTQDLQSSLMEKESLLSEKEVLLKEIHHRVKNNLQVISSLLYLNSRKIKDENTLNMFKDSQNRVKSIALVHERLYRSNDLGKIDFREYIIKLTNDLFRSYGVNQSMILLEISIEDVYIDIDNAVPCGLIVNELISNSLKYAFRGFEEMGKTGKIKIESKKEKERLILVVSDSGLGMPEELDEKKKDSLGLQLVDTLVAQLEGELKIDLNAGTKFTITFHL